MTQRLYLALLIVTTTCPCVPAMAERASADVLCGKPSYVRDVGTDAGRVVKIWSADADTDELLFPAGVCALFLARSPAGPLALTQFRSRSQNDAEEVQDLLVVECGGEMRRIATDRRVLSAAWSPEGHRLAYVGATGMSDFEKRDVFIANVATGEIRQIAKDLFPEELCWTSFDRHLYIRVSGEHKPRVLRYDEKSGALEKTPYFDVNFSPDGKYYLYDEGDWPDSVRVVVRPTNTEITGRKESPLGRRVCLRLKASFWLDETHFVAGMRFNSPGHEYVINVEDGQIRKSHGDIRALYGKGTAIVVRNPAEKPFLEEIAQMPVVRPEDLPDPFTNMPVDMRREIEEDIARYEKEHDSSPQATETAAPKRPPDPGAKPPGAPADTGHAKER